MGDLFGPQQRTSCGPGGVARILRYSSTMMPVTPIRSNRRDRVRLERSTLLGGIWAFAALQLSPPCGRSMASASGGPLSPPNRQGQVVRRVYDPRSSRPVAAVVGTMVVVSHVALLSLGGGRCRSSRRNRRLSRGKSWSLVFFPPGTDMTLKWLRTGVCWRLWGN